MTAFFRRLMGRTQDGRQAAMLKAQLSALAAAHVPHRHLHGRGQGPADRYQGCWRVRPLVPQDEDGQRVLWP